MLIGKVGFTPDQYKSIKTETMNEDVIKGKWNQFEGELQKEWGKLTDNDMEQLKGEAKLLKGKLQEKYGHSSEEAKKQIDKFKQRYSEMVEDDKEKIAAFKQKLSKMLDDDSTIDEA